MVAAISTRTITKIDASPVVITDELEGSAALVLAALEQRGWEPQVIQLERLATSEISFTAFDGENVFRFLDAASGQEILITPSTRVLRRRPSIPAVNGPLDPGITTFIDAQYRVAANVLFTSPAVWMNDAAADRRLDQNKILGSRLAAKVGFDVIPTVLTDSPQAWQEAVHKFGAEGDVAVKPAGAWAARASEGSGVFSLYTTRLTPDEAIDLSDAVRYAPVLVQPYVEKLYELRVTVVDKRIFACRIDSQASPRTATDWRRYDFANTRHEPWVLPLEVKQRLLAFMRGAGLLYAAIDLIIAPDGRMLFVEANPAGQFGWIEELTGLPIGAAIADWLLDRSTVS